MASQQQKPQEPWHSLDQQMGSSDHMDDLISKPFSLRQYVLAARQKDIYLNWPFADRYLQICLKHGISNVLPTLELCNFATNNQLQGEVRLENAQEKKEDFSSEKDSMAIDRHEVGNNSFFYDVISEAPMVACHLSFSSNSSKCGEINQSSSDDIPQPTVPMSQRSTVMPNPHPRIDKRSTETLISHKILRCRHRKRKRKPKKRSMVDILAVAKGCTLQDLYRFEALGFESKKDLDYNVGEERSSVLY